MTGKTSKTKKKFESKVYELKYLGVEITPEFKFCKDRKFKADFLLQYKGRACLIEYEGIMSNKSRHTGVIGYNRDTEKYNLACSLGYYVFRYTALNYRNITNDIINFFGIEK